MGEIVGAAIVSHHPGLMQTEEFRREMGNGADSDLIAGFARLREKIDAVKPDALVIFDSHWFTTGFHLYDAGAHFSGTYVSDEMPWYLNGLSYDYDGVPDLAHLCEEVARECGVMGKAVTYDNLNRHYATLNVVHLLKASEPVMSVSTCQNCETQHFLESGSVVGEAIRRSNLRVVLLGSGALSHKFNGINWTQKHPRLFHSDNVSDQAYVESDLEVLQLFREGRHDVILERFPSVYAKIPWEGLGGHYLNMVGALGGADCRLQGEVLSDYENARGTGNVHVWFDTAGHAAELAS